MGIEERKQRERTEREARIIAAARWIAETEGWEAVTVRRLAKEIEYSQPVLYSHFENRDAIVAAVARQGFVELAGAMSQAAAQATEPRAALIAVAGSYCAFAQDRPALYAAMFVLPSSLRFADAATPDELRAAFAAMAKPVSALCPDAETVTETFWAALHGLVELERAGRIRPGLREERLTLVVNLVAYGL